MNIFHQKYVTVIHQGSCAFVCVWPSNIGELIQYIGFLSWIFWGLCFVAVIVLRYKMPDIHRPFKVVEAY
jgi:hypothetical protein